MTTEQQQAEKALSSMKGSLKKWLVYRKQVDEATSPVARAMLDADRLSNEQPLATQLHTLLAEMGFNTGQLPSPDVARHSNAAVALATVALTGKLPSETSTPVATGFVWMWPLLLVGGAVLILSSSVKSFADASVEKEKIRCIAAGRCTDYGFWLKAGAVLFAGWLFWDRLGGGARVKRLVGGRR